MERTRRKCNLKRDNSLSYINYIDNQTTQGGTEERKVTHHVAQSETHISCRWWAPCVSGCSPPDSSGTWARGQRRPSWRPSAPSPLPSFWDWRCLWSASLAAHTARPSALACPSTWWRWAGHSDGDPDVKVCLPCRLVPAWTSRRPPSWQLGCWWQAWAF